MDAAFHYPPDLLNLLIDTIPRLCRSKRDVLLFFQGAGSPASALADLEPRVGAKDVSLSKFEIARTVLTRLNKAGDATLGARRQVLRRVVEFQDFTTCYDDQRLAAQGLVANVRALVNARDTVTKIAKEREADRDAARGAKRAEIEREAARRLALADVRDRLGRLFAEANPHRRGKALEGVLNDLFAAAGLQVRDAFTLRDPTGGGIFEQIDGVVSLDGHLYLVEMKWWAEALGPGDVAQHQVRVFNRGQARGLFIASSGYTPAAVAACREQLRYAPFVLAELREFVDLLDADGDVATMLRAKVDAAMVDKDPLRPYDPRRMSAHGAQHPPRRG